MLFSSPAFFLFFAFYFAAHLLLPLKARLALIIIGSTFFYAYWNPYYVWIPFAIMLIAYHGAIWMMGLAAGAPRRRRMLMVVMVLLLPLLIIKYTNFVYAELLAFEGQLVAWELPLGISFITFTLIAYVVDVYSGRYRLERSRAMLAGLVLFFPHLIAGPILRPAELLPQLHRPRRAVAVRVVFGIVIFSLGLLKKLVFADPMAAAVDTVYAGTGDGLSALDYLLAIYGFALQIYCDFSGYTDMAIGTAIMLGVRLPTNFQMPYISNSIVEFWTRWHMSLSRWLRDYLYIALGGNRCGFARQIANLFITMGLGGLWHGANWTFVIWGIAHGACISVVHAIRRLPGLRPIGHLPSWLNVLLTFHFVTACWILFRAPDISTAWRVMRGPFLAPLGDVGHFASENAFLLVLLALFLVFHRWDNHRTVRRLAGRLPKPVLWPAIVLVWTLAITVSQGSSAKFIYFDF